MSPFGRRQSFAAHIPSPFNHSTHLFIGRHTARFLTLLRYAWQGSGRQATRKLTYVAAIHSKRASDIADPPPRRVSKVLRTPVNSVFPVFCNLYFFYIFASCMVSTAQTPISRFCVLAMLLSIASVDFMCLLRATIVL
ncbi:hypothetical protein LY78DRAFT_100400 [Colletotrichum sublineola]|nr:hypothetical protein LY78DRAFT_100400 [Colletotrichum sublineola]